jgi:hypothetical protein
MANHISEQPERGVLINPQEVAEWMDDYENAQGQAHEDQLNQRRREDYKMAYDQEDNVITVWLQEKSSPKSPSYTGKGLAWGKATRAAVWHNVTKNGKDYLKIKLEEPRDSGAAPAATKKPSDDIPF